MSSVETRLAYLFRRYLDNACSAEELTELLALISEEGNKTLLLEQLKQSWENDTVTGQQEAVDWDSLYNRMMTIGQELNTYSKKNRRLSWLGMAATAVLLTGLVAWGMYWFGKNTTAVKEKPAVATADTTAQPGAVHQLISLPDGSIVLLNTNSKLDYPASFNGKTREVFLTGEAYFDIKHNSRQPFLVHTGGITTKVLGTAFNIKAYPVENTVSITVARGKVEVRNKVNTLGILIKNQQITIDKKSNKHQQLAVDAGEVLTWKKEDLIMEDITFSKAIEIIEKTYPVQVILNNPKLMNCRFTATFLNHTSLEQVLTVLCELNNASFTKQDDKNVYIITGEGCDR